jgi:hypothetical protein
MAEFNVPSELILESAVTQAASELAKKLISQLWQEAAVRTMKRLEPRIDAALKTIKSDEMFVREFREITTASVLTRINDGARIHKWIETETPLILEEALTKIRGELVEKIAAKILGAFR